MKQEKNNKSGFTLLELLVVILIIGILAGIALPQYRRAKEKAEASELLVTVKAVYQAQQRYFLTNGEYAKNFDDLDINLSGYERGGCEHLSMFGYMQDCFSNDKNTVHINSSGGITALRKTGKYKFSGFLIKNQASINLPENKLLCYEYARNGFCSKLFKCNLIFSDGGTNNYYSCNF